MINQAPEKTIPDARIAVWTPWGSQKARKTAKRDRIPSPARQNEVSSSALDRVGRPRITAA